MSKPVVLFLAKSFPIIGGVERWMSDLVCGLAYSGLVPVVGLARGLRFHNPAAFLQCHPDLGSVVCLDGSSGAVDERLDAVTSVIKSVSPKVVVPVMLADGLAAAAELKASHRFSIVYPIHELSSGVMSDLRLYGPWIDRIVLVDDNARKFYEHALLGLTERLVRIPCGVPSAPTRSLRWSSRGKLTIGWCGRLQQQQKRIGDLDGLCEALERKNVDFTILVAGASSSGGEALRLLEPRVAKGQVRLLGALSRSDLSTRFYSVIHALLITSEWETGPLVAFEAMMHGVPVVTSNFDGRVLNDALRDGENCLVFPVGDMDAAAARLTELVENPSSAACLIENGTKYAREFRSLEAMCASWSRLLLEVAKMSPLIPERSPQLIRVGESRLARAGVPRWARIALRRLFGRTFVHDFPGQEWPSYSESGES